MATVIHTHRDTHSFTLNPNFITIILPPPFSGLHPPILFLSSLVPSPLFQEEAPTTSLLLPRHTGAPVLRRRRSTTVCRGRRSPFAPLITQASPRPPRFEEESRRRICKKAVAVAVRRPFRMFSFLIVTVEKEYHYEPSCRSARGVYFL